MDFSFTVTLKQSSLSDADVEKLYGTFNDGSIVSRDGQTFIGFDREGASLQGAIASAITDIRRAGFEVQKIEIDPTEIDSVIAAAQ